MVFSLCFIVGSLGRVWGGRFVSRLEWIDEIGFFRKLMWDLSFLLCFRGYLGVVGIYLIMMGVFISYKFVIFLFLFL